MATSAIKLAEIVKFLSTTYEFEIDDAMSNLAKKELLPKKMMTKSVEHTNYFASKQAEEFASKADIGQLEFGKGTGKNGNYTLKDLKNMVKIVPTHSIITPSATNYANKNKICIDNLKGTGKNGTITLSDIKSYETSTDDEELNISARALEEANKKGMTSRQIKNLTGTGNKGRVLIGDVQKFKLTSDDSDDDEEEESDEE